VADREQVEKRGRKRKARKTDEHHRNHGVPNKYHVAPERRADILRFDHGL
jgi:hypothetical protein